MNALDIKNKLAEINGSIEANDIDDEKSFTDQGFGSLDTFDLFLQIEEELNVKINDDLMTLLHRHFKPIVYPYYTFWQVVAILSRLYS